MIAKEIQRAFNSIGFRIALLIGSLIALSQYFISVLPASKVLAFAANEGMIPHSVFSKWIGADTYTFVSSLYFMALPLLCTLPHASSYYKDMSSGYIRQIVTRTGRSSYFRAKYISVFISAGMVTVLPLILNLYLTAVTLPSIKPVLAVGYFPATHATRFLPTLMYEHPYIYTVIYLLIIFVFSGGIASISLAISLAANNQFVVLIAPFIIVIFIGTISTFLGHMEFNTAYFLQPGQPIMYVSWFSMLMCFLIYVLLPGLLFFTLGRIYDIY